MGRRKKTMAHHADNQVVEPQVTSRWYRSVSDRIYMAFIYVMLVLAMLLVLVPFIFILASSFSSAEAISAGKVLFWPVGFNVEGYKMILETSSVWRSFLMSLLYMVAGTLISLTLTVLMAYPLTRKDFKANSFITVLMIITMFFSGGMIPTYLLINRLNMLDTVWAILLPTALSAYNVVLVRTYMSSNFPKDLYECASLDGCSDFRFVTAILIPISKPIIAVMTLFFAMGHWNSYFDAMIYLNSSSKFPLQLVLKEILLQNQITPDMMSTMNLTAEEMAMRMGLSQQLKYALIVVSSVPLMILYPFIQKYFVKGVMIGSIKG